MPTEAKKPEIVWVACRAREGCEGKQAEVVFSRAHNATMPNGGFLPVAGGRTIRYTCLTCKGSFHIST